MIRFDCIKHDFHGMSYNGECPKCEGEFNNNGGFDLDNFIFIGNKIADKIYEIPEKDLNWFNIQKKKIMELIK